jgi:hypothetical protein
MTPTAVESDDVSLEGSGVGGEVEGTEGAGVLSRFTLRARGTISVMCVSGP